MSAHLKFGLLGMKPSHSRHCKIKELLELFDPNEQEKILACDTEDNSKGKTIMTNFFDGENHYTFRSTEAAVEWLTEYSRQFKRGVVVWFANTQYDIGNVFRESQEQLSFVIAGSRFITGKVYQEKIKFRDIFNVIPGSSVKSLGKMIKFEKMEVHGNFDNEEYCQRDTEIVYWSLLKYRETLKKLNVELKNTAASTGFTALLKTYSRLAFNLLDDDDHEFMKAGYYGGRTEVFFTKKIKGQIYAYDIVSSYPAVMRDIPLIDTSSKIYTRKPNVDGREGMSDCLVETPDEIDIPYLPVKMDGKLMFPRGSFRGTWTYFELREAKKLGYKIKKHYRSMEFKTQFDFKLGEFVEKIYSIRHQAKKDGDDVLQYACKIILNASYGKFAMGNEKTELAAFEEFHKIKGNFSSELFPNNQILIKRITSYAPTTNYLTASLITAMGRHKLYGHLIEASKNGRTLLYADTDSVFFSGKKFSDSYCGSGLGDLQFDNSFAEAHFILPKTYMLKKPDGSETYKCKGVRGELAKEFFTKGFAENMQPLKYIETCRKNFYISERNKKNGTKEPFLPFNLWVKKPKSLKSKYSKRISQKNGTTRAVKLNYDLDSENQPN